MRQAETALRKDDAARAGDLHRETKGHGGIAKDANTRALEKRLTDLLGLEVSVDHRGEGGTLKIKYRELGTTRRGIEKAEPLKFTTAKFRNSRLFCAKTIR